MLVLMFSFLIYIYTYIYTSRSDFLHKLAVSVITNNNPAIRTIDLSHNLIEDKGKQFSQTFSRCCYIKQKAKKKVQSST